VTRIWRSPSARAVPEDATCETHEQQREQFKQCALGVQYGMGVRSLALRIAQSETMAHNLLRAHREAFPHFWRWSDRVVNHSMQHNELWTRFGWYIHVAGDVDANPRSLRNFPMQANGAEMLRLACCYGTERGIEICAPVHDAVLICAPLDRLGEDIARMQAAMLKASKAVLAGFELGTDVHEVHHPNRYMDKRGVVTWERVINLIARADSKRRTA
jgi:DNA polymerase I-like protein with 3'-5' exonuclease and polymerase domains